MARIKKNEQQITFATTEEELNEIFGEEAKEIKNNDVILIQDGDKFTIKTENWERELTQTEYERTRILLLSSKEHAKSKRAIRKEAFININKNLF